jgi:hypothetical protein
MAILITAEDPVTEPSNALCTNRKPLSWAFQCRGNVSSSRILTGKLETTSVIASRALAAVLAGLAVDLHPSPHFTKRSLPLLLANPVLLLSGEVVFPH